MRRKTRRKRITTCEGELKPSSPLPAQTCSCPALPQCRGWEVLSPFCHRGRGQGLCTALDSRGGGSSPSQQHRALWFLQIQLNAGVGSGAASSPGKGCADVAGGQAGAGGCLQPCQAPCHPVHPGATRRSLQESGNSWLCQAGLGGCSWQRGTPGSNVGPRGTMWGPSVCWDGEASGHG